MNDPNGNLWTWQMIATAFDELERKAMEDPTDEYATAAIRSVRSDLWQALQNRVIPPGTVSSPPAKSPDAGLAVPAYHVTTGLVERVSYTENLVTIAGKPVDELLDLFDKQNVRLTIEKLPPDSLSASDLDREQERKAIAALAAHVVPVLIGWSYLDRSAKWGWAEQCNPFERTARASEQEDPVQRFDTPVAALATAHDALGMILPPQEHTEVGTTPLQMSVAVGCIAGRLADYAAGKEHYAVTQLIAETWAGTLRRASDMLYTTSDREGAAPQQAQPRQGGVTREIVEELVALAQVEPLPNFSWNETYQKAWADGFEACQKRLHAALQRL